MNAEIMDLLERTNDASEQLQAALRAEFEARHELELARIAFRQLEVRDLLAGVPGSNEATRRAYIEAEHPIELERVQRAELALMHAKLERETAQLRLEVLKLSVQTLGSIGS